MTQTAAQARGVKAMGSNGPPGFPPSTSQGSTSEVAENPGGQVEQTYPPTSKVIAIISGLYMTAFLISLDRFVIGVAVPRITDQFHSLGDVGWYGSAYLLTACSMMLLIGRLYTMFNPKWVYLIALVVFEIGSAVCGTAPNSKALIVGRAIAGLGCAGLFQGAIIIMVHVVPLHKRPQYMGIGGLVFGFSSAVGPLIGGALTNGPGWRWCFYINLPCGAVAIAMIVLFLHIPAGMLQQNSSTLREKAARLDWLGTACFLPGIICLILALQWGGVTYSWSNARVVVLLVLAGVLFVAFVLIQRWKGKDATIPGHILLNRSILAGVWFSFYNGACMQTMLYFLPIWFQAIKGASPIKSGVMTLPLVIGLVIASVSAGILTKKTGYFTQWMILSSIITPIGAGLTSTFSVHTGHAVWITAGALSGFGFGLGSQQPSVGAQTVLARQDVPIGASLMMFSQMLGGAVFISVGNNVFDSRFAKDLAKISGLNVASIVATGATELRSIVSASMLPRVLVAYNEALRSTFYLATALASATIFGSVAMEWRSVKKEQKAKSDDTAQEKSQQSEEV
ncbi:DNA repair protein RAD50 [Exophiala viscosa]|uniref:DNA repair protein RAD50 n=1 Tax=Exophiala viscosa TaxID=2486360 RepID=A0AAN6I886_9EURO|nr:DNA repair protein RAD50 [Exophiala viscosa]KAI1628508.1 DNA repair protein RAD50 [Exophiala viscosa]